MGVCREAFVVTCVAVLVACGANDSTDGAGAGAGVAAAAPDTPCVTRDADSGDVVERGRLVQLDIALRYQAKRALQTGSGDGAITLEADSVIQGTASQLACAWDLEGGAVRYELERVDGETSQPFAARHAGKATLSGTRTTYARGMTVREEVDVSGPLETLVLRDIGVRASPDVDVCVILAFDAPLRGRSLRRIDAPGIQRQEHMNPSELASDGDSALSPKTFDGGDHRFVDEAFSVCTGKGVARLGEIGPPEGMTISADGLVWQRSGAWANHASAPVEQRTVEFTLRIVPPMLAPD